MQRRDVLKLLGTAAAISALPQEALAILQQASAQVAASTGLRTFNPHQNATVTTLAELIIPETDTPGAKGARVNEFIDLLLTEWFEPTETRQFLAGLADVDQRSQKMFAADFVNCKLEQQTELLKQLDDAAMEFTKKQKAEQRNPQRSSQMAALPDMQKPEQQEAKHPPVNFFYQFKKLTLTGYYTSEIGFEKELGKSIIPSGHSGCAPLSEVTR
ncbi:gluconate 2-dehydrogenase subunit 3 family protein [Edaphobacter albus]|uniref:gluconate 2-dehydrogenase subunit 3 family protein n=1 Tax=Edaphobacter sp. 4G125 TaxID=2763071 RepID=UPI00164803AD|nr:gluconate 2-dehydrogenase subunit 3 family protein [Edaphobacter sp. 4G125]QNI35326.1 gluconate 2-dehydrogenase subunit 3 family protein [Edaphobacter sp. 4G125]